jgi:hypothetical protein
MAAPRDPCHGRATAAPQNRAIDMRCGSALGFAATRSVGPLPDPHA